MGNVLFSATGCTRCSIVKKYLRKKQVTFEEHDAIGAGKEVFAVFYRAYRNIVARGAHGIEFPIWVEDKVIRQGLGMVIAHLHAGEKLKSFIGPGTLDKGWLDGIHLSHGDPADQAILIEMLRFLQENGIKLQFSTWGRNAALLDALRDEGLGNRVVMTLLGSLEIYNSFTEQTDPQEASHTMSVTAQFPEYRFETNIYLSLPEKIASGRMLTTVEVEAAAFWLKQITGSHRQPYILYWAPPETAKGDGLKFGESVNLFTYRSAARRHQVAAEIRAHSDPTKL